MLMGDSLTGSQLGHYVVRSRLGKGGMGVVYRALDQALGREVALKVLPPEFSADPDRVSRFRREARALARLDHEGIVTVYSIETISGSDFVSMALIDGLTLVEKIPDRGLSYDEWLDLACQLASALAAAHAAGIVHRDLKPSNVMVTHAGRIKILDFGLARPGPTSESGTTEETELLLTRPGVFVGTPGYAAPEQLEGRIADRKSDVFSLGILLHEMATGRSPFGESTAAAILSKEPASLLESRPDWPSEAAQIVGRCLDKDPASRYPSARELEADLLALASDGGTSASSAAVPTSSWLRRGLWLGLLVVMVVAAGWWVSSRGPFAPEASTPRAEPVAEAAREHAQFPLIAILPFESAGGELAAELTRALGSTFARVPQLYTVSADTMSAFGPVPPSLEDLASQLEANYVLAGEVVEAGGRPEVAIRLLDAARKEQPKWRERFVIGTRPLHDVAAEIALEVAQRLGIVIPPESARWIREPSGGSAAAALALAEAKRHSAESISGGQREERDRLAVAAFERAIQLSPNYIEAWAALARHHANKLVNWDRTEVRREAAREAAERAMNLDPGHPAARLAYGSWLYYGALDSRRAEAEFLLALAKWPGHSELHYALAIVSNRIGKSRQAADHARIHLRMSPFDPRARSYLTFSLVFHHAYEEAVESARKQISMQPGELRGYQGAVWALTLLGRFDEAREVIDQAPRRLWVWLETLPAYLDHDWEEVFARTDLTAIAAPALVDKVESLVFRSMALYWSGSAEEAREAAEQGLALVAGEKEDRALQTIQTFDLHEWDFRLSLVAGHPLDEVLAAAEKAQVSASVLSKPCYEYLKAAILLAMGDRDKAVQGLRRSIGRPQSSPISEAVLRSDPIWRDLWDDPRFEELLSQDEAVD